MGNLRIINNTRAPIDIEWFRRDAKGEVVIDSDGKRVRDRLTLGSPLDDGVDGAIPSQAVVSEKRWRDAMQSRAVRGLTEPPKPAVSFYPESPRM